MKILVTGANGYLGKGIVSKLLDCGHVVIATDLDDSYIDKRSSVIKGNIFEIENPYETFLKPDCVLHLAWRNGFVHYANSHIDDLHLHYHFLEKLIDSGIKKVCVLGTMHEIGLFDGCIGDDTPCKPTTPYGICKNALRQLTETKCKTNNTIFQWLRGFYIVGNTCDGASIFSKLIQSAKEHKTNFPFNSGKIKYDFLDYNDFCEYVALAITQDRVNGIINICSGKPESLGSRVERFIKDNHLSITLDYGAFPDRAYDPSSVWGDPNKIRNIIQNEK